MTRAAWLTDIHLNFLRPPEVEAFYHTVAATAPDFVLLSGDIAEAPDFERHLRALADLLQRPIYFVPGNHDFYRGSITAVRRRARELTESTPWLRWLPACGVVGITAETCLVGHDSWGDGRLGNGPRSSVLLNDFWLIEELGPGVGQLYGKLAALGDEAAAHFRRWLPEALEKYRHVIVLVHVPPFREACWHQGRISDDDWLPHFTCAAVGDVLLQAMGDRPDRRMTVLCGHTHSGGAARPLPNLEVKTGGSEYGRPQVQEVLVIE